MRKRKALVGLWTGIALLVLNAVLLVAQPGLALPNALGGAFRFGQSVVRAEVIVRKGNRTHAYRVDRGTIRAVLSDSIVLVERDGLVVTVRIAPNADVRGRGGRALVARLRRGMYVETIREGDAPATTVTVLRR